VRALRADGRALPFAQDSFGAAFVIVTLCFASDPHGLLREAARVTRGDGGVVLGIVPAQSPWGRLYAAKGAAGNAFYSHARLYSVGELEAMVRDSGMLPERWSCTLFDPPAESGRGVEPPRAGRHALAGFAAVLCRPAGRAKP
jgi:SAM-dependent methyltransferase